MAISYIGGVVGGNNNSNSGLTVNYSSAAGNFLALSFVTGAIGNATVEDSNAVFWTVVGTGAGGGSAGVAYLLNAAAITSVTITFTPIWPSLGGVFSVVLAEYSGAAHIVGNSTAADNPSPWTVTRALALTSNWLVGGGGVGCNASPTVTSNTGNLRNLGTIEGGSEAILVDNTGSFTETCSANFTPTGGYTVSGWLAVGLEIQPPTFPTVTTQAVTSITSITATGNGNITFTGSDIPGPGFTCSIRGVVYNTTSFTTPANGTNPATVGTVVSNSGTFGTGAFTESLTGLTPGTTYYVCAFANNSIGYSYGAVVSFTTMTYPIVTTQLAGVALGTTTGTGNGNITSLGFDVNCTITGFVYDTASHTLPANGTVPASSGYANNVSASGTFGLGAFSETLTGLTGTTYYVRAFAANSVGYSYGNQISVSTLPQKYLVGVLW